MNLNKKTFQIVYWLLISIEIIIVILTRAEILSLNYGWEARMNVLILIGVIGFQIIALVLTNRIKNAIQQVRLLQAQSLLYLLVIIWLALEIGIDYQYLD
ncbi:MAG: hypothetical protein CL840_06370 [Crocinitomicaceae bacterium]|nr:hypothetical protein [Crocinitomicaceae bacterium]|tara:strand:- start:18519 stop:18818 length:300 start_codon:yes stop_codon:yes gene_type:complete